MEFFNSLLFFTPVRSTSKCYQRMAFHSVSRWHRAETARNDAGISEVRRNSSRALTSILHVWFPIYLNSLSPSKTALLFVGITYVRLTLCCNYRRMLVKSRKYPKIPSILQRISNTKKSRNTCLIKKRTKV